MPDLLDLITMYRWPRRLSFAGAAVAALLLGGPADHRVLFAVGVIAFVAVACELLDRVFRQ